MPSEFCRTCGSPMCCGTPAFGASIPPASPEREAVYRAVDAFLAMLEGIAKRDETRAWTVTPVADEIAADEEMRFAFQSYFFRTRETEIAHKESSNAK
jgi:hypothetical protein